MVNPIHLPPKTPNVSAIHEWFRDEVDPTGGGIRLGNAERSNLRGSRPNIVLLFNSRVARIFFQL